MADATGGGCRRGVPRPAMKRDTWIPGSNDLRFETPFWVVRLDAAIGRLMCRLGIHTDSGMSSCWYCGKAHGPRK